MHDTSCFVHPVCIVEICEIRLCLLIYLNHKPIPCEFVLSLSQLKNVTPLPESPKEISGVIDFRGHMVELIDIKNILNFKPTKEEIQEFCELMDARRQDHINWLTTLENSVKNETEFTLTTDPHKCAFRKWYDSYNPDIGNIMFLTTFSRFNILWQKCW